MSDPLSVSGVFVQMLIQGAQGRDYDPAPILARHGVSQLSLGDQGYRLPIQSFAAVTNELMQLMDDEFLGMTEKPQPLGSFNMMCRACLSTESVKHSMRRCANFWNLFRNTFEHRVLVSSGRVYYELHQTGGAPSNNYAIESMLSTVHRFHCWLGGQFIPLLEVNLSYPKPEYSESHKPLFYGAPIRYQQPQSSICFAIEHGNADVVQTPSTLVRYLAGQNLSLLNQPKQYRAASDKVSRWMEKEMRRGRAAVTLAQTADHFNLSPQVLHRRLSQEDTSFRELKQQMRRDIAIDLLFSENHKVEEISELIGFSEPSAFIRAFKSWTGTTPYQYRQQQRK